MRFVTECTREVGRCPLNGAVYVIAKTEDPDGAACWQWFAYAPRDGYGDLDVVDSGVVYGSMARNEAKMMAVNAIKAWEKRLPR